MAMAMSMTLTQIVNEGVTPVYNCKNNIIEVNLSICTFSTFTQYLDYVNERSCVYALR